MRWSIFIDVEGFSEIYQISDAKALQLLGILMLNIWKIGSRVYPNHPDRLFIHQYGDGFLIVSNHREKSLDRPLSIAIYLMQTILIGGGVARAGISEGDFADVTGCFPSELREELSEHRCLRVGEGIMNIQHVMGNTLIHSNKLQIKVNKKGPLLFLDGQLNGRYSRDQFEVIESNQKYIEIDWIHSYPSILEQIFQTIEIEKPKSEDLISQMKKYIEYYKLTGEWEKNSNALFGNSSRVGK